MADAYHALTQAAAMVSELWDNVPIWHENRFGTTARHITRAEAWQGTMMHKMSVTQMLTNARMDATLEAPMPDATLLAADDELILEESHLRRCAASIAYTIPASMEMNGGAYSVWNIAEELAAQTAQVMMEKKDQMIHANAQAARATVLLSYDDDGQAYPGGNATTCFVSLTGSVSMFHKGETVDIRVGVTDVKRVTATISDVIRNDTLFTNANGPGLVLTYLAQGDSAAWDDGSGDTDFDNVDAGDEIVAHDERIADGYPGSFGTLCDYSASAAQYFNIVRNTVGSRHWIPNGRAYTAATPLDLRSHFGAMWNVMTRVIPLGRAVLERRGVKWTKALICQAAPELLQEAEYQAGGDTARWTRMLPKDFSEADRKLISVQGWDGVLIKLTGLPPLALEPEALMPADKIRVWDPNWWTWVRMGGANAKPKWLRDGGGIWHLTKYATAAAGDVKLTPKYQAACLSYDTLVCEKPATVYEMQGLADTI